MSTTSDPYCAPSAPSAIPSESVQHGSVEMSGSRLTTIPTLPHSVRPETLVRICDECNFGTYGGRCCVCGSPGEPFRGVTTSLAGKFDETDRYSRPCLLLPFYTLAIHHLATACTLYLPHPRLAISSLRRLAVMHPRSLLEQSLCATGISDAYYCAACTRLEKDRDGCPKIVNLGASRTDMFYERKKANQFNKG